MKRFSQHLTEDASVPPRPEKCEWGSCLKPAVSFVRFRNALGYPTAEGYWYCREHADKVVENCPRGDFIDTPVDEDAAANSAGGGGVAGIGIGPKGEPGIDLRKRKKQIEQMAADAQLDEDDDPLSAASIIKSLQKAAVDQAAHEKKRAAVLDAQPDGTVVKLGRREYVKQNVGGDVFWVYAKGGLSSRELAIEMGTRLEKQFGPLAEATDAEREAAAKEVHARWMDFQKDQGHDSHKSPDGKEEYMVDYDKLSEPAKDLDRMAVNAVLDTLGEETLGDWLRRCLAIRLDADGSMTALTRKDLTESIDHFAGAPVFDVDMDRMMKLKGPKHPRHRYSRYVGVDEMGETIRQHGRAKKGDIIVKEKSTGVMTYLRRKQPKG